MRARRFELKQTADARDAALSRSEMAPARAFLAPGPEV